MQCPHCNISVRDDAKYCTACGRSLAPAGASASSGALPSGDIHTTAAPPILADVLSSGTGNTACPNCQASTRLGAKFCHQCGHPLTSSGTLPVAGAAPGSDDSTLIASAPPVDPLAMSDLLPTTLPASPDATIIARSSFKLFGDQSLPAPPGSAAPAYPGYDNTSMGSPPMSAYSLPLDPMPPPLPTNGQAEPDGQFGSSGPPHRVGQGRPGITPSNPVPAYSGSLPPPPPFWTDDLLAHQAEWPKVNYALTYENMDREDRIIREDRLRYAVAEALFGLVASGASVTNTFHEVTKKDGRIVSTKDRIGTYGTSMIRFPRAAVESYCTSMLGAELFQAWAERIRPLPGDPQSAAKQIDEIRRQRNLARAQAETIRERLEDTDPLPGVPGYRWASLKSLEDDRSWALQEETERLFAHFSPDRITGRITSRMIQSWETDAWRTFGQWQQTAERAWNAVAQDVQQRAAETINGLSLGDAGSIMLAQKYLEAFEIALQDLRNELSNWRVEHKKRFDAELARLAQEANGPWSAGANSAAALGVVPPATPTAAGNTGSMPALSGSQAAGALSAPPGSPPGQPASNARLPDSVQDVVRNLGARFDSVSLPTPTNLIGVALMAIPPLALLAATLISSPAPVPPLEWALCGAGGFALAALIGWFYRLSCERTYHDAKLALLRAYQIYFAYRCEQWEDQLRVGVLGPLIRMIQRNREFLEHLQEFILTRAEALRRAAAETERELFEGPSSARDALIALGKELSLQAGGLGEVDAFIRRLRESASREDFHKSSNILEAFHRRLAERHRSIMDLTETEIEEGARAFSREVIAPYLTGDLVSVHTVLTNQNWHTEQLWTKAQHMSQRFLHRLPGQQQLPYLSGRQEDLQGRLPPLAANTTITATGSEEWVILSCLKVGGSRIPENRSD